jgi:hypothetical protein
MFLVQFTINLTSLIIRTYFGLRRSKKFATQYLHELESRFNGKFDQHIFNKVIKWNSILQHFVCNSFSDLYGRYNTAIEEERNLMYFTTTALYDEIIDTKSLPINELDELFYHPEKAVANNFEQAALLHLHLELLNQVPDKEEYWTVINNIHTAQKDSIKQFDSTTNNEDLLSITQRKGGYSLLMCRHYLDLPKSKEIDTCWYMLGSVIQMTNDLYDIYKDVQAGIETFATRAKKSTEIESIYINQVNQLFESIKKLPFPATKRNKLLTTLSAIPSFGYIALENLKKIQGNSRELPTMNTIERNKLIIDMEKPQNLIRLIKYSYQLTNQNQNK